MVGYARRNFAILTTVGAMVVTLLLIVFFGAWAVASAGDADISSITNSATSGFAGAPYQPGAVPGSRRIRHCPPFGFGHPGLRNLVGQVLPARLPVALTGRQPSSQESSLNGHI